MRDLPLRTSRGLWHLPQPCWVGQPQIATSVPSTRAQQRPEGIRWRRRSPESALASLHVPLVRRGPAQVDHNIADDDALIVSRRLSGERVLIVDDTFTTGARLQSAASALYCRGASAVAAIVVGRVIDPDWTGNCRRIWDDARETQFSFDHCCLCRA